MFVSAGVLKFKIPSTLDIFDRLTSSKYIKCVTQDCCMGLYCCPSCVMQVSACFMFLGVVLSVTSVAVIHMMIYSCVRLS